MPRYFAYDSSNTPRLAKRIFAYDSGNVPRAAKRIFAYDSSNTARLVFASSQVFTMVAGEFHSGADATTGFSVPGAFGSITPTHDIIGNAINVLTWFNVTQTLTFAVSVATNPGINYFNTIQPNTGAPIFSAASASFVFGGGVATWEFHSPTFSFVDGTTYTVTVQF
jgi:hypothetical protein